MDLEKIKERINYSGEFRPTYEVLKELQMQFLLHVPFENLNIHLNIPLDYSSSQVFHKIVEQKRGGLCYENNSLFYDILKAIGFNVNFIKAEMFKGLPLKNDENHMHMALLVQIDDEMYLVDVGNGKSFGNPIPVKNKTFSKGEDSDYIVDDFQEIKALYFKDSDGKLTPRYVFGLEPKTREDFKKACIFIETSPESVFLKGTLASQYQANGRETLTGSKVIATTDAGRSSLIISSKEDLKQHLEETFGIFLEENQIDHLFEKPSVMVL